MILLYTILPGCAVMHCFFICYFIIYYGILFFSSLSHYINAKTVNVYTTLFHSTWVSYFEQEGGQKRRMLTQHVSTPHEFHILNRKGGKNGKCLHNTFLFHMNFIFWAGRGSKTANVYRTHFYSAWISYFEQEGWQIQQMFTQHISTPHEFHILNMKGGKYGKCLLGDCLPHVSQITFLLRSTGQEVFWVRIKS